MGDQIQVGDFLGEVGNSGVSFTPHLHMTMYYYSEELSRMVSVPTFFKDIKLKTAETNFGICSYVPTRGDQILGFETPSCDL